MCFHLIIRSKYPKLLNSSVTSTVFYIAPLHAVQTCFGAHAPSSSVSNKRSFPEGKAAGA